MGKRINLRNSVLYGGMLSIVLCIAINLNFIAYAQELSSKIEVPKNQSSNPADSQQTKKEYYFKKILENEITFLKTQLKDQEEKSRISLEGQKRYYEGLLQESKSSEQKETDAAALERKISLLEEKLAEEVKNSEKQKKNFEEISKQQKQQFEKEKKESVEMVVSNTNRRIKQAEDNLAGAKDALENQKKNYEQLLQIQKQSQGAETSNEKDADLEDKLKLAEKEKEQHKTALENQKQYYEVLLSRQNQDQGKKQDDAMSAVAEEWAEKLRKAQQDYEKMKESYEQSLVEKGIEQDIKIKALMLQYENMVAAASKEEELKKMADVLSKANTRISALVEENKGLSGQIAGQKQQYKQVLSEQEKQYNDKLQEIIAPKKENGMQREQEIGSSLSETSRDNQIKALSQQIKDLNEKLDTQKKAYEQLLTQKDEEFAAKQLDIESKNKKDLSGAEKLSDQKLAEKYRQLDEALREKELMYSQKIVEQEQKFKDYFLQSEEKEQSLRQLIAAQEVEFNKKRQEETKELNNKIQTLQDSSEQLKIYLIKLKEELKLKAIVIQEKDKQVSVLNEKLALYSEEAIGPEKNGSNIITQELERVRDENTRISKELELSQQQLAKYQETQADTVDKKKKQTEALQTELDAKLAAANFSWEKKINLQESKYDKQIKQLEQDNEREKEELKLKLDGISAKLRDKVSENEELKSKLNSFRSNQVGLLEELLLSKAEMLKKIPQDFKGENKDRAQSYFQQAMNSIISKNYSRAEYELKQVLSLEPNHQMTINILGNLNFLLGKKQ